MAGQTITLQTPLTTADTAASVVSKINTDLSAIQVELARKVTPDDMLVTTDLSMVGHYITEAGGVILEDTGLSPSTLGTVYYSDGDLWVVTSGGAVQITDSGAINVASAGGITGDYPGTSGASVDYTHSTLTYAFMDSASAWSNLKGLGYYILNPGLTATTKLASNASTSGIWYFCNLPVTTAGTYHMVTVDSAGTLRVNDQVDAAVTFGSTLSVAGLSTLTGGSTAAADQKHTDTWSMTASLSDAWPNSGAISKNGAASFTASANPWSVIIPIYGLRTGDKITSVVVPLTKTNSGTVSGTLFRCSPGGVPSSILTGSTSAGAGLTSFTISTGSALAIVAGDEWFISISGTTDLATIYANRLNYTHP